ncbi:hypothetical protein VAC51_00050 [Variovorax phage VAC_51]|uniref:Uncharacterized protein n=1 Tax=Variovorax phage VAC_51 TaxID=2985242 RepID=A0A9N6WUA5_9CAUD|nr:hypothetical protein VAC51_00050 [Variovorax phage VAC_51]
MVIDYKDWSPAQHEAADTAMLAHFERTRGYSTWRPNSYELVKTRLANGEITSCFIAGFLLFYDVGQAWSTEDYLLYEQFLTRAMPHGTFKDYVDGLRQLCSRYGCTAIESGNGVLRPGLRRQYERAGFIKTNETYFMEVTPNGQK